MTQITNHKLRDRVITALLLGFTFLPGSVFAAELYFSIRPQEIRVGDTFVVEARISSPDNLINVADGSFLFGQDKLEVRELSSGGSIFDLWVEAPSFSNEIGRVSFVGGTTDGFQGPDGLVLRAALLAKEEGAAKFEFGSETLVFLHDGRGTKVRPGLRPLTLSVLARSSARPARDEWVNLKTADRTPPEFKEAILAHDPGLFGGKHFVTFFATDAETGVAYYEVKEGESDFVRAVSPYVLEDQTLSGTVTVKAVDLAGNESIATPVEAPEPAVPAVPEAARVNYTLLILAGAAGLAILVVVLWRARKK